MMKRNWTNGFGCKMAHQLLRVWLLLFVCCSTAVNCSEHADHHASGAADPHHHAHDSIHREDKSLSELPSSEANFLILYQKPKTKNENTNTLTLRVLLTTTSFFLSYLKGLQRFSKNIIVRTQNSDCIYTSTTYSVQFCIPSRVNYPRRFFKNLTSMYLHLHKYHAATLI